MVTQTGSVTGRKVYSSQIPAIQARAELLPYYKQQQQEQANADRTYQTAREQLDLNRDVADQQAKQADKAARMARMQLGMETGIGIGRLTDDGGKSTTPLNPGAMTSEDATSQASDLADSVSNGGAGSGPWYENAGSKAWDAATSGNTWASTAFGALAGPELGDAALKKSGMGKRERRMLGGAAAGGAAGLLSSGGDPYTAAISAGLSSLGGLF